MEKKFRNLLGVVLSLLCLSVAVPVNADEDVQEFGHPQLVVESYEIVEGSLTANTDCTLRVYIKNVDEEEGCIAGQIAFHSEYFAPVTGTTNQRVFGEIASGETIFVDFEMNLNRLIYGPNVIELDLGWRDENGAMYSNPAIIAPVVLRDVEFEITSIKIPKTIYGTKVVTFNVSYENTGDEELGNITMFVEGDIEGDVFKVDIAGMSAGQSDLTECQVQLLKEGLNEIKVSFMYEDRNGNVYTSDAETITTTVVMALEDEDETKISKEMLKQYRVFIGAGVVAIVLLIPFIVSLFVKKGKKK